MTLNALWRLIRTLFVALGAPACMIACVWRRDAHAMRGFAHLLETIRRRGTLLRYASEDDAVVAARIARLKWIARDPNRAARHIARHMVRDMRGFAGARIVMSYAPPSFAPPRLAALAALAVLAPLEHAPGLIDTS